MGLEPWGWGGGGGGGGGGEDEGGIQTASWICSSIHDLLLGAGGEGS